MKKLQKFVITVPAYFNDAQRQALQKMLVRLLD
ncbi:Hsp70 family protein [Erysipelothrix sp. Poltava]|nr:Hsp70 family protein [Erysipelothrix sp. Poltava]